MIDLFDADNERSKRMREHYYVYPDDLELYWDGYKELREKWLNKIRGEQWTR